MNGSAPARFAAGRPLGDAATPLESFFLIVGARPAALVGFLYPLTTASFSARFRSADE